MIGFVSDRPVNSRFLLVYLEERGGGYGCSLVNTCICSQSMQKLLVLYISFRFDRKASQVVKISQQSVRQNQGMFFVLSFVFELIAYDCSLFMIFYLNAVVALSRLVIRSEHICSFQLNRSLVCMSAIECLLRLPRMRRQSARRLPRIMYSCSKRGKRKVSGYLSDVPSYKPPHVSPPSYEPISWSCTIEMLVQSCKMCSLLYE